MKKIFYSILLSGMMVLSACVMRWTCLLKIIMALMIFGIRSLR